MIPLTIGPINDLVELSLRFMGIWPDYGYKIICRLFWIISMSLILIFQYWYVLDNLKFGDLPDLMDCLSITLSNSVFFIKLIIFWIKNRIFKKIVESMINDWKECVETKTNVDAMTKRITLSYNFSRFFLTSYAINVIFFSSFVLINNKDTKQLILKMKLPFDYTISPIYEIVNIDQFVLQLFAASLSSMLSALLVTLVLHVDGQVEILRRELSKISFFITERRESCKKILISSILRHQRIIAFTDNLENVFTYIALVQFLSNTVVICALGFVIVTSLNTDQRYAILSKIGPYYILANIEAFVLCFAGEFLKSKSAIIEKSVYDATWYELDPTESKILLLLLVRSQRRFAITAGKFMDMSLEGFASMLKASGSYLSVLYAMY